MYSFYIVKKYLFGRGKLNAINGIAIVSFIAISLVAFGLVVVLSVFNGYVDIINKINADIDPPMLIKLKSNKNFPCDTVALNNIISQKDIVLEPILYSKGVLYIEGENKMVFIQGLGDKYFDYIKEKASKYNSSLDTTISATDLVVGKAVACECLNKKDISNNIKLIIPKRVGLINPLAPASNFIAENINISYILDQKRDDIDNTIFMDIKNLSNMLSYDNKEASAIVVLSNGKSVTKDFVSRYLDKDFVVQDKYDQHPELNFIIKSEKLMTFFIMLFILLLAVFNVSGCILMMMIEKKNDCSIIKAIGMTTSIQKRIFRISGMIISVGGIILGTIIGVAFVLLQEKYGFIYSDSIQNNIQPIPVDLHLLDVFYIIIISVAISYILILYSTRYLKRICLS